MGSFIPRRKRFWRSRARSIYHRLARLIGGRARDDPSGDRHVSPDATHDIGLASKNDDTPIANRVATPSYDGSLIPNSGSTLGNDDPLVSGSCPAPSHDDPPVPNSCSTPSNDHTTIPNSRPIPSSDHPTIPSIVSCSSPNYDGPPSPTRGSTPRNEDLSTTRSLWDRAYDSLKEENPKLVEDYEKLLSEDTPGTSMHDLKNTSVHIDQFTVSVSNDDPPALLGDASPATNNRPRKAQLDDIMAKGIQRLEEGKTKYTIAGHEFVLRDQVAGAAKLVLWAKNLVTEGVKASPEASIAWAGVCIILPLLTNPQVAEEANRDGFTHVTARMRYYAGFEPLSQNLSETDGVPDGVKEAIEGDMLRLYQKILEFQIQSVLRFYQSCFTRYVRDVLSTRDWKQMKLDIEGLDREFNKNLSQINEFISTEKLKSLSNTSKEALDTMRQFMSVFEEQLRVEKRQLEIQEDEVRQKLSDKQKACLQLFRLTSSDKDTTYEWYKSRVEDRVEGTCEWFLKHDNFQTWLEQDSGPLLVSADPGCGKSVLAKYLIDHGLPRSPTICYFFFKDQDQNTVRQALCALLHQLFTKRPWLIKHAVEQFDRDGRNLINSTTSLWTVLGEAVQDPKAGPIIIVLDALDECAESEFEQLIQNVKAQFRGSRPKCDRLKYLLTSRPYEQVVSQFWDLLDSFPHVHIPGEEKSDIISQEVNCVINYRVEKLARKKGLTDEVKNHLKEKLLSIPHRTYLWVYLVFDYLRAEHFKKTQLGVDHTMATLPKTVNEAYERILSKSKELPTVRKALSIILVATKPLTIAGMNVAMNVDSTTKTVNDLDLEGDEDFKSRLRSMCGLFISIHHEKIYFLHQTAREFLLAEFSVESIPPGTVWQHSITRSSAHMTLAEVCVIFLNLFEVRGNRTILEGEQSLEIFFHYASWNWDKHFQNAHVPDNSSIMAAALRLCDTHSRSSPLWWDHAWGQQTALFSKAPSNLEIAAYLGLDLIAKQFLEVNVEQEVKHYINDTLALVAATTRGHDSTVKLLLESRIHLEAKDERGNTPLLIATTRLNERQIKLLLDAGADLKAKDQEGRTPLHIAAYKKSKQIAKLLLDAGADLNAKDQYGRTPLHILAAYGENEQVAKLLLDAGADLKAKDQDGRTPLHILAAYGESKQVAKLLLNAGADLKAKDQKGWTPLHILAAYGESEQVVKLLLDAGADLKAKDQYGRTPLHIAAAKKSERVAKLLLDAGADCDIKDK
ncbi:putative ankyrin repeat protein [Rosellinia necatrix]|uniref:Putative ankyrin repeat protein n=1 Tax=Rosellinia necatrix TaxID=77044 RepID=A0A1S7UII6_ROSNE|nr:putative ankyrin repeat protein [Rosellinia necatrix]